MKIVLGVIGRLSKSEDAVTAIEYGLIAVLISLLLLGGAQVIGVSVDFFFNTMGSEMQSALGGGP